MLNLLILIHSSFSQAFSQAFSQSSQQASSQASLILFYREQNRKGMCRRQIASNVHWLFRFVRPESAAANPLSLSLALNLLAANLGEFASILWR